MTKWKDTDEYIAAQAPDVRKKLEEMRRILRDALPEAKECISYGMPALREGKVLVYYAAAKHHIGFYPTPGPIEACREDLKPYHTSKGAVQFPLEEELPEKLIRKMAVIRQKEVTGSDAV